jgi:hypothetical protein
VHENDVNCQALEPKMKRIIAAQSRNLAMELEKCFLGQILSRLNIADHPETERVNTAQIAGVQNVEALTVTSSNTCDGFIFVAGSSSLPSIFSAWPESRKWLRDFFSSRS